MCHGFGDSGQRVWTADEVFEKGVAACMALAKKRLENKITVLKTEVTEMSQTFSSRYGPWGWGWD